MLVEAYGHNTPSVELAAIGLEDVRSIISTWKTRKTRYLMKIHAKVKRN